MADVTIREATPHDVDGIRRVADRGWHAAYGDILSRETIEAAIAEWYDADAIRELVDRDDTAYFVAEDDGDIVGYVGGGPSDEDGVATLGAIYVDPDRWGEGIGTALLNAFETSCRRRDYEVVRLRVLAENDVGSSFYRTRGYAVVDERETELFGERVCERVFRGRIDPTR